MANLTVQDDLNQLRDYIKQLVERINILEDETTDSLLVVHKRIDGVEKEVKSVKRNAPSGMAGD